MEQDNRPTRKSSFDRLHKLSGNPDQQTFNRDVNDTSVSKEIADQQIANDLQMQKAYSDRLELLESIERQRKAADAASVTPITDTVQEVSDEVQDSEIFTEEDTPTETMVEQEILDNIVKEVHTDIFGDPLPSKQTIIITNEVLDDVVADQVLLDEPAESDTDDKQIHKSNTSEERLQKLAEIQQAIESVPEAPKVFTNSTVNVSDVSTEPGDMEIALSDELDISPKDVIVDNSIIPDISDESLTENSEAISLEESGSVTDENYKELMMANTRKRSPIPLYDERTAISRYVQLSTEVEATRNALLEGYTKDEIANHIFDKYGERITEVNSVDKFFTNQRAQNLDSLANALNNNQSPSRYWEDAEGKKHYADAKVDASYLDKFQKKSTIIRGNATRTLVSAITSGIKRVYLANSGFYINLKGPLQIELDQMYKTIYSETFEHGKTFGQYYFFPCNTEIEMYIMNALPAWVIESNLKDWTIGDTLVKNISYHDYESILWAIASLMHPRGITLDFPCGYSDCPRPVQTIKTDLNQIRFINYDAIPMKAKGFLHSASEKSEEELAVYRKDLLSNNIQHFNDNWAGQMHVPTMYQHLQFNSEFNTELALRINKEDEERVTNYITKSRFKFYAPFIEKLIYKYGDDANRREIIFEDDVSKSLEDIQASVANGDEFFNNCKKFIANTKLTHIGYPYSHCPTCKRPNTSAIGGIIPCDVQSTFFSMLVMKLNFQ